jgi:hypothetical protein
MESIQHGFLFRAIAYKSQDAFAIRKTIPQPPSCCFVAEGGEKFFLAVILTPLREVKITAFFLFPALGRG